MNERRRRRGLSRCLRLGVLLFALAACGGQPHWHSRDIRGLLPDLPSELSPRIGSAEVRLLFFGYTHCPHLCPATLARLDAVSAALGHPPDLRIVFISVDPRRDTRPVLRAFLQRFRAPVSGLRPDPATLRVLSRRYRVGYGYGDADDRGNYAVSHPAGVYVFDRQGRARLLIRPSDRHDGVVADLRRLLAEGA
ncbi:SCO family protein [Alkalilimnicola sp. S0819]|uniref:SCO family protein n=1 Tax=Alkalilimnicola sp. S0819 TaxID=2613922 RepID=UPI0012618931|nr:SCO family protein [Alkalilimnicola sp. S0819]KAB7623970.1 SCO family protein [Alkalilimnicola sp. S0819]MPQ16571.1 SCO family protein [Alkalilimnicola sp. S0819]